MLEKETVRKIAQLSRLELTEEEVDAQFEQLTQIVDMMSVLNNIDTAGVEPLNHVMDVHNVMREDIVEDSMAIEKVLQNAPEQEDDMFRVPRIV